MEIIPSVSSGVDAGKYNLTFPQQAKFARLQFLSLGDKVALCVDFFHGVHQLGTGSGISLIAETGLFTSAALYQHFVAVCTDGGNLHRCADGSTIEGYLSMYLV